MKKVILFVILAIAIPSYVGFGLPYITEKLMKAGSIKPKMTMTGVTNNTGIYHLSSNTEAKNNKSEAKGMWLTMAE